MGVSGGGSGWGIHDRKVNYTIHDMIAIAIIEILLSFEAPTSGILEAQNAALP